MGKIAGGGCTARLLLNHSVTKSDHIC